MRRLLASLPLALLLAACSPSSPPAAPSATTDRSTVAAPTLGSAEWYAWVDQRLGISEDGHGPDRGTDEWNLAVQQKLGEEAPQSRLGSPEWQQAVDALLRTRMPAAQ